MTHNIIGNENGLKGRHYPVLDQTRMGWTSSGRSVHLARFILPSMAIVALTLLIIGCISGA